MAPKDKELADICVFCVELWGDGRRKTCKSACTCATYITQDCLPQRERTIGLPTTRSWNITLVPPGAPNFWEGLSDAGKARVREALPDLLRKTDPVIGAFLEMLLRGSTKEEICQTLKITNKTYDKYAERLRTAAAELQVA